MRSPRLLLVAFLCSGFSGAPLDAALTPSRAPSSADDLRIGGLFQATSDGTEGYLSRSVLLGAPGVTHIHEAPADSIPSADLTVIPINLLLRSLPLAPGADGLVLTCSDNWVSFLPLSLVETVHPYLLLKYAGRTPEQGWPRFSVDEGMNPYFSNWSPSLGPKDTSGDPFGEFDATQIVEIRAVNTHDRYAPFYEGALARISPAAGEGRKIFIRECNVCHAGPRGVGGDNGHVSLATLEDTAVLRSEHFKAVVINPKAFYPKTVAPAHDTFTPEMMSQLIAFLTEARQAGVN